MFYGELSARGAELRKKIVDILQARLTVNDPPVFPSSLEGLVRVGVRLQQLDRILVSVLLDRLGMYTKPTMVFRR